MTEIFLERKKIGQIQELLSNMRLILSYTVQLVIPNVCTKFDNPKSSSCYEIFDDGRCTYALHRRDGKIETFEKEGKINISNFLLHNILGHPQDVYKVWRPRLQ